MTAYMLKYTAIIDMELLCDFFDGVTIFGFKGQSFLFSLSTPCLCFEVFIHILPAKAY